MQAGDAPSWAFASVGALVGVAAGAMVGYGLSKATGSVLVGPVSVQLGLVSGTVAGSYCYRYPTVELRLDGGGSYTVAPPGIFSREAAKQMPDLQKRLSEAIARVEGA